MATGNKKEKFKKPENNQMYDSAIFEASTGHKLARFIQQVKGGRKPTVPIFDDISSQSHSYNIEIENIVENTDGIPKNNDEGHEKPIQNRCSSRKRNEEQLMSIHSSPFKLQRRSLGSIGRRTLLKEFEKTVGTDNSFKPPVCSTPFSSKNQYSHINKSYMPSPIDFGLTLSKNTANSGLDVNEDLFKKLKEDNERLINLLKKADKKVDQEIFKKPTTPDITLNINPDIIANVSNNTINNNDVQATILSQQGEQKSPADRRKSNSTPEKINELSQETPTEIGKYKSLIATPKQRQALLKLINKSCKNDKNTTLIGQESRNDNQPKEIPNIPTKETQEQQNEIILLNALKEKLRSSNRLLNTPDKNCCKTQETVLSPNLRCARTAIFRRQSKEQIPNENRISPKTVENDQCNSVVNLSVIANPITGSEAHDFTENIHECTSKVAPIIVIPIHQIINEAKSPRKYKTRSETKIPENTTKKNNKPQSPLNLLASTDNRSSYVDLITDDDEDYNNDDIPLNLARVNQPSPTILDLRKKRKLSKTKTRLSSIQDNHIKSSILKNNKCAQKHSRDPNSNEQNFSCKVVLRKIKNISKNKFQDLSLTIPQTEECVLEKGVSRTEKYDQGFIPESQECIPESQECIPESQERILETVECVPATEECVPATKECVPETQENIQADGESDSLIPETQNTDNLSHSSNLNMNSIEIVSDENLMRSLLPPPPTPFCDLVGLTSFNGKDNEVTNLIDPTESIKNNNINKTKQPIKYKRKKKESTVLKCYLKATDHFKKNRKSNEDDSNDTGNRRKLFTKGDSCDSSDESIQSLANKISSKSSKSKNDASSLSSSVQKIFDNFLRPATPPAKLKKSHNKTKQTKELINISKQKSNTRYSRSLEANGNDNIRQETEENCANSELSEERCQPVEPGIVLKGKNNSKKQNKLNSSVSASASDGNSAEGTGVRVLTRKRRPPIAYWCNEPIDYYPLYVYNEDVHKSKKNKDNNRKKPPPQQFENLEEVDPTSSEGISSGTNSCQVNKKSKKTADKSLTNNKKAKAAKNRSKKTKTINHHNNTSNTGDCVAPANSLIDSNEPSDSSSTPSMHTSRRKITEVQEKNINISRNLLSKTNNGFSHEKAILSQSLDKSFSTVSSIHTFNSLFDSLKNSQGTGEKESTRNDVVVVRPSNVVTPIIRPIQSKSQEKNANKRVIKKAGRSRKKLISIEPIIETENEQIPQSNAVSNERTLCHPSIDFDQIPQTTEEDTNFWTNLQQNQPAMTNNSKSDELLSWLSKMITPKSSEASMKSAVSKVIHHANGFESATVDDLVFYESNGVEYAFYSGAVRDKIGYMRFFPQGEKTRIKSKKYQLVFILLCGTLTIECNDILADFKNGDLITIEKGSTYSIKNNTDDVALTMVIKK